MRTASTSITIISSSLKKNEVFVKILFIDIYPDIIKHSLIPTHQDPRSTLRFLLIDNPLNIFCIFPFFITYYSNPTLIFPKRMFFALSLYMTLQIPLHPINFLKFPMNVFVVKAGVTFKCTALVIARVNINMMDFVILLCFFSVQYRLNYLVSSLKLDRVLLFSGLVELPESDCKFNMEFWTQIETKYYIFDSLSES